MFTMNSIKGLKPKERQYELFEDSGEKSTGRLGVSVGSSGSKTFVYRFYWNGKRQYIQLGKFPEMSLSMAREQVKIFGGQLKSGRNPKNELKNEMLAKEMQEVAEAEKGSIKQLIDGYVFKMQMDGKRTHLDVKRRLEKDVYQVIPPATKAKDVTSLHVKQILINMIQRGAVVQSNRVRSYLHAAFQYGLKSDFDPMGNHEQIIFGLSMNPVAIVPRQAQAEKPGDNWLKKNELCQLMESFSLANKVSRMVQELLRLCVYTGGQRPYELASSQWKSINWQENTLLITSEISKNKREHLVPLTDSSVQILKFLKENSTESNFIFPQRDGLKPFRTDSFAQAIGYYREQFPDFPYFVARDIRRTCKTLMGELGISKELRDRIQNHAFQDVSSKHYDRYDYLSEKRVALEKWEAKLNGTMSYDNVIHLVS